MTTILLFATGCTVFGGGASTTETGTPPNPLKSPETGLGSAIVTIEGFDLDTKQPIGETFEADLTVASSQYFEDEARSVLFFGFVAADGDGSTTQLVEVAAELTYALESSGPPGTEGRQFGLPNDEALAGGGFTLTTNGAFTGRLVIDGIPVTEAMVNVSSFEVSSTTGQCLSPDAMGNCETSVGTMQVDATIVADDGAGTRIEMDLQGPVGAFWSELL
ncbi:MAG: hypothetical protein AAGA48_01680 [Myxococcota bacterium]